VRNSKDEGVREVKNDLQSLHESAPPKKELYVSPILLPRKECQFITVPAPTKKTAPPTPFKSSLCFLLVPLRGFKA
jgi:hypothetical protein